MKLNHHTTGEGQVQPFNRQNILALVDDLEHRIQKNQRWIEMYRDRVDELRAELRRAQFFSNKR